MSGREHDEQPQQPVDTTASEEVAQQQFRFSLQQLFYLTALLAAGIALFEETAPLWFFCVMVFWILVFILKIWVAPVLPRIVIAICVVMGLLSWEVSSTVQGARPPSPQTMCLLHIKQLGFSLLNYETTHGNLPPATIKREVTGRRDLEDVGGKGLHSWRVLLLPYLEQPGLFAKYDFTQRWNGPSNRQLYDPLSAGIFACPARSDAEGTPYKLVTGLGTAFEGHQGKPLNQIPFPHNTIAIIEDSANPVNWMSPEDLTVEQAVALFDVANMTEPDCVYESKFRRTRLWHRRVGFLDGTSRWVGWLENPQQIVPYLMVNHPDKGEFKDLKFIYPERVTEVLYSGYFLLAINIIIALLPCFWKPLQPMQQMSRSAPHQTA